MIWPLAVAALMQGSLAPNEAPIADQARRSFSVGRFSTLLPARAMVRLELRPGSPASSVRGELAAAVLKARMRRQTTDHVAVISSTMVDTRQGYVEMIRRYRATGSQEQQSERILLATILDQGRWRVVEILFVDEA